MKYIHKVIIVNCIGVICCAFSFKAFASTLINTKEQSALFLQKYFIQTNPKLSLSAKALIDTPRLTPVSSSVDFNQTEHIRFNQTYRGVRVWGGEVIAHAPHAGNIFRKMNLPNSALAMPSNTSFNGIIYENLNKDLVSSSRDNSRDFAQQISRSHIHQSSENVTDLESELVIYINPETKKGSLAYFISFAIKNQYGHSIEEPRYIVDVLTQKIYLQWNDLQTDDAEVVSGGGLGGNPNIGKLYYDGITGQYPSYEVRRLYSYNPLDTNFLGRCYIENKVVKIVINNGSFKPEEVLSYPCKKMDAYHNNLYWNDTLMSINGGYSPPNDAIYGANIVNKMYQQWYGVPVLINPDTTPMQIIVKFDTHDIYVWQNNASWVSKGQYLWLGHGSDVYYPFSTLGILSHELSHGFTSQHSKLVYVGATGAMNESFSDMADQALQYFLTGKNNWRHNKELIRDPIKVGCKDASDCAVRYFDDPKKDGKSFDNIIEAQGHDVHHASGVFNKMFYLLSTQPNWNTKMAFDVMVHANQNYWTSGDGSWRAYKEIACGILSSVKDFQKTKPQYDEQAVITALKGIGFQDAGNPDEFYYEMSDIKDCE